ncbi:two-component system regulatory protein YycI [Lactobacillus corticis]|uniref:Regulatory protein YycH-like domain-containing protein n=1 Tax=Lactobacillus corticis TaxID=2201249 RepID=A0A916VHZ5_9LACO|nr:two-component system regulatory protein YycI [Lactobacillus corticis]GFZ27616.1 hypothetical protein LCB40_14960 [Lactobacillus corticis]
MDHKRIEWLFLIIFSLIDLYLAFEIFNSPVQLNNSETGTASSNARVEMRADGISLPRNLSSKSGSGYYLAATKNNYLAKKVSSLTGVNASYSKSDKILTATPQTEVAVGLTKGQIASSLTKFKNDENNVPYGKQFKYEPNLSSGNSFVFVQTSSYGNIYDDDATLTFTVKKGRLVKYEETYIGAVSPVRELQSTISAWRAIYAMYTDQELANNTRVTEIKLGYTKMTTVRGNVILIPSWLVWVKNKESGNVTLKRVNAFNGEVLQTNTTYNLDD